MAKRADSRYEQRPLAQLAEGEGAAAAGARRRRLHEGPGPASAAWARSSLAVHEEGGLRWVGNVGTGFTEDEIDELLARLRPLERPDSPLVEVPKMPRVRKSDVVWVEPTLVVEVAVRRVDARRPPACSGLPRATGGQAPGGGRAARSRARSTDRDPEGQAACSSSPTSTRSSGPSEGITKGDLLAYYREIAPVIVPHLQRPARSR